MPVISENDKQIKVKLSFEMCTLSAVKMTDEILTISKENDSESTRKRKADLMNSWLRADTQRVNNYKTGPQKWSLTLPSLIQNR